MIMKEEEKKVEPVKKEKPENLSAAEKTFFKERDEMAEKLNDKK